MISDGPDSAGSNSPDRPASAKGPIALGPIAFGQFVLDLADARLTGPDGPVAVGNKALRVLATLVAAHGRLLTKDMLFDQVWEGVIVSDAALTSVIKELRRALGDDPKQPRFIESVYGKGYRFLAAPTAAPFQSQGAQPQAERFQAERPELASVTSTNLPPEDAPLIGRKAELETLDTLLDNAGGLVTIVGSGGMGKTRLALAAARLRLGKQRDGVWLVELARIVEARDVVYRVAEAIGIVLGSEGETMPALTERLRRRECLIVLDNCEHVIDGAAALATAIRAAAPGVTVLATSQAALGVVGEHIIALEPLDRRDATALFLVRVSATDPAFAAAANDDPAIPRICDTLDRLPLAIEMAAARAPALGCAALLERLGANFDTEADTRMAGRFAVLTRGSRDAPPRHRTLYATLAWSHGLLGPEEATVFRRLAVFGGAFPLDAAVAVAGLSDEAMSEMAVLDALDVLVARSLLVRQRSGGAAGRPGEVRYVLLETMRAFARERLVEAGEHQAAHRAHAVWYAAAAEPIWADFCGDVSDVELERRHRENIDNVFAAVRWSYAPGGDPELGHIAVAQSAAMWSDRLLYRRLGVALARIGPQTPPAIRARLLGSRAHVLMRMRPLEAVKFADEAVIAARATTNDPWTLIDVLCSKGFALWSIGRAEEASAVAEDIAAILPVDVPSRIGGLGLGLIACTTFSRDGLDAARPIFARAVAMLRAIGAHGLATFWAATALRFEATAPLDAQIDDWRALLAGITLGDMYADIMVAAASVELVSRLAMRGRPADLAEAQALTARAFRQGAMAFEYRFFVASALVALRSGRAEDGARLLGHARASRAQSGESAMAEPAFDAADALAAQMLPAETRKVLEQLGARMSDADATALALSPSEPRLPAGAAA
ncbi:winged helix-turn-helix domain-containing protein [Novosphingobium sp.]|uniref:winged helix-turn-helix domain-containing protein n=1 Tax=Novosphingobium sp. TaxID=1874826 RepID=UPI0025D57691|nr:winged helix-turn-helix domain-containing protein [Novosphingobium sp.]